MNDFPCSLHPDSMALQISKCPAFHQLCSPCWTEAYKSRHCPCCHDMLEELLPKPIYEYQVGKCKAATKFDFRHRLPYELLDEMIKFCPLEHFPRSSFYCRPKNVALLLANSALNTLATNQLKLKKDFYFKRTLTMLLTSENIRIFTFMMRTIISDREVEKIATKMLRNNGKPLYPDKLPGNEMDLDDVHLIHINGCLYDISLVVKWQIQKEMKTMNII